MSGPPEQQVSRGLLIALGTVVALAAAYALWAFVVQPLAEDADEDVVQLPEGTPTIVPTAGPGIDDPSAPEPGGVDPALTDGDVVPETFEIFTARDPFQQLVVEGVPAPVAPVPAAPAATTSPTTGTGGNGGPGSGTGTGGTGGGTGTGGGGTGAGSGSGTGAGSGQGGQAPSSASIGSTRVTLVDVFDDRGTTTVQVDVDGTLYEVVRGEVFAQRFELLAVDGLCATFLFGDSRFTLCEGESITK